MAGIKVRTDRVGFFLRKHTLVTRGQISCNMSRTITSNSKSAETSNKFFDQGTAGGGVPRVENPGPIRTLFLMGQDPEKHANRSPTPNFIRSVPVFRPPRRPGSKGLISSTADHTISSSLYDKRSGTQASQASSSLSSSSECSFRYNHMRADIANLAPRSKSAPRSMLNRSNVSTLNVKDAANKYDFGGEKLMIIDSALKEKLALRRPSTLTRENWDTVEVNTPTSDGNVEQYRLLTLGDRIKQQQQQCVNEVDNNFNRCSAVNSFTGRPNAYLKLELMDPPRQRAAAGVRLGSAKMSKSKSSLVTPTNVHQDVDSSRAHVKRPVPQLVAADANASNGLSSSSISATLALALAQNNVVNTIPHTSEALCSIGRQLEQRQLLNTFQDWSQTLLQFNQSGNRRAGISQQLSKKIRHSDTSIPIGTTPRSMQRRSMTPGITRHQIVEYTNDDDAMILMKPPEDWGKLSSIARNGTVVPESHGCTMSPTATLCRMRSDTDSNPVKKFEHRSVRANAESKTDIGCHRHNWPKTTPEQFSRSGHTPKNDSLRQPQSLYPAAYNAPRAHLADSSELKRVTADRHGVKPSNANMMAVNTTKHTAATKNVRHKETAETSSSTAAARRSETASSRAASTVASVEPSTSAASANRKTQGKTLQAAVALPTASVAKPKTGSSKPTSNSLKCNHHNDSLTETPTYALDLDLGLMKMPARDRRNVKSTDGHSRCVLEAENLKTGSSKPTCDYMKSNQAQIKPRRSIGQTNHHHKDSLTIAPSSKGNLDLDLMEMPATVRKPTNNYEADDKLDIANTVVAGVDQHTSQKCKYDYKTFDYKSFEEQQRAQSDQRRDIVEGEWRRKCEDYERIINQTPAKLGAHNTHLQLPVGATIRSQSMPNPGARMPITPSRFNVASIRQFNYYQQQSIKYAGEQNNRYNNYDVEGESGNSVNRVQVNRATDVSRLATCDQMPTEKQEQQTFINNNKNNNSNSDQRKYTTSQNQYKVHPQRKK